MTALAFLLSITVLFASVLFLETDAGRKMSLRPAGLFQWFISGNWPAKVGAALMIIGVGALLRYLMLNIELPPETKLTAGVGIAALLGFASAGLRSNPKRRAIHLALGGAALGTVYLTAYSAYGFFHFVSDLQALSLLFIVALGATVFAITTRALSIAILAMIGAYLAPAFALETPGIVPVYGYYILASLLVLIMVAQRGWRPLIHLSFLFTLAGALFFGWTQKFYSPTFYSQMQPFLLALVAIHLAMPLLEKQDTSSSVPLSSLWLKRFDVAYFLLLPLVSTVLTLVIAPDVSREGVWGLFALSALWFAAAVIQQLRFKAGAVRYAGIGLVLLVIAALFWLGGISFFLICTVAACALLALGPELSIPRQMDGFLIMAALASAACYLLQALFDPLPQTPFFNAAYAQHAVLAIAFAIAGYQMQKRDLNFGPIFLALAAVWLLIASTREFTRLYFDYLPQAFHLLLLGLSLVYALVLKWKSPALPVVLVLGIGLFYSALLGVNGFSSEAILPIMLGGQFAFSLIGYMAGKKPDGELIAGTARSMLPLLILPWAIAYCRHIGAPAAGVMVFLVTSALFASMQAQFLLPKDRLWPNTFSPVGFIIFSAWLLFQALFHIQREPWAVAYEILAVAYLVLTLRFLLASDNRDANFFTAVTVISVIAVCAAMLLRLIGPEGTLTIFALNDMLLPAVVSLFWAGVGAAMTWQSTLRKSRKLWTLGAVFLVVAAVKLVLFDFGSLGQLGNIIAMIAAGGIFLLVAWLAPFPPKSEKETSHANKARDSKQSLKGSGSASVITTSADSSRVWLWIVLGLIAIFILSPATIFRAIGGSLFLY